MILYPIPAGPDKWEMPKCAKTANPQNRQNPVQRGENESYKN